METEVSHSCKQPTQHLYIFCDTFLVSCMNRQDVNQALNNIRPCNVLVSDGRCIYVDNPETVLLSETVLVIGKHAQGRMVKELAMVALAHITGIEPAKPRPLRKVA